MPKIAIVQRPPVLLDRSATMERAVQSVREAAAEGASLVVLPAPSPCPPTPAPSTAQDSPSIPG